MLTWNSDATSSPVIFSLELSASSYKVDEDDFFVSHSDSSEWSWCSNQYQWCIEWSANSCVMQWLSVDQLVLYVSQKKSIAFSPSISLVKFTTRTSDPMQSKRSRALTVQKHAMFQLYMLAPTHGASRKLPTLYCSSLSWMGDNTNAATVDVSRARQAIPLISRWGEDGTVQMPHLPRHRRKRSNKKAHRKCSAENLHSTFILPAVDESATCPITDIYWFHVESYSLVNPPTLEIVFLLLWSHITCDSSYEVMLSNPHLSV